MTLLADYMFFLITPLLQAGFLLPPNSRSNLPGPVIVYSSYGIIYTVIMITLHRFLLATYYNEWAWRLISIEHIVLITCAVWFLSPVLADKHTGISIGSIVLMIPVSSCAAVLTASRLTTKPLVVLDLVNTSLAVALIGWTLLSSRVDPKTKVAAAGLFFLVAVRTCLSIYRLHGLWEHWEITRRIVPMAEMLTSMLWFWTSRPLKAAGTQTVLRLDKRPSRAAGGLVYAYEAERSRHVRNEPGETPVGVHTTP